MKDYGDLTESRNFFLGVLGAFAFIGTVWIICVVAFA